MIAEFKLLGKIEEENRPAAINFFNEKRKRFSEILPGEIEKSYEQKNL
jgi:hypothetical protein